MVESACPGLASGKRFIGYKAKNDKYKTNNNVENKTDKPTIFAL